MLKQYIFGKDSNDYKILAIQDASIFKQMNSLETIEKNIKNIVFRPCYLSQSIPGSSYVNGAIRKGKVAINSATLEENIKLNLQFLILALVFRKSDKNTTIGYIIYDTKDNNIKYLSRKSFKGNYKQIINLTNNGVVFDSKEATIDKIYIEDLNYNINQNINYNNSLCKIIDKDDEKDYLIENENKDRKWIFSSEIIKGEVKKEDERAKKLLLQINNKNFKGILNVLGGLELKQEEKESFINDLKIENKELKNIISNIILKYC